MIHAEQARELQNSGVTVTLDGKPARISGFKEKFGTVWDRTDNARSAEWAWDAIVRVMKNGGDFKT